MPENSRHTSIILSGIVRNRTEYYRLLDQLCAALGREIDTRTLDGEIDSDFAGRESIEEAEASLLVETLKRIEDAGEFTGPTPH